MIRPGLAWLILVVLVQAAATARPALAEPASTSVSASSGVSTTTQPGNEPRLSSQPGPPLPYAPAQTNPPSPVPSAQPYSPPAYPAQSTCASCPPGTLCQNGYCLPPYYPSCPVGMVFDGVRNCVPAGYYQYPPAAWRPDPEEQRILAQRLGNRMRPKFTLDVQGAIGLMGDAPAPVMSPALLALAGYRQNYAPWFGLQLRGGLLLGVATYSHSSSDNSYYGSENSGPSQTAMFGGIVEVVPLFGPFGRFLVGPLLWAGYLSFADSMLYSGSESVGLRSGTTTGFGGEFGFVLGDRERTVLSFALRASALNTVTIFMSAGIGFHI